MKAATALILLAVIVALVASGLAPHEVTYKNRDCYYNLFSGQAGCGPWEYTTVSEPGWLVKMMSGNQ